MDDEDGCSTALGFYRFAHSYWRSAVALKKAKAVASHRDDPIWFLYLHAIELYLKAYLRAQGVSAQKLKGSYGHDIGKLAHDACLRGMEFEDDDHPVISSISDMNIFEVRYIKTGCFKRPSHQVLNLTCRSFDKSVKACLKAQGIKVKRVLRKNLQTCP